MSSRVVITATNLLPIVERLRGETSLEPGISFPTAFCVISPPSVREKAHFSVSCTTYNLSHPDIYPAETFSSNYLTGDSNLGSMVAKRLDSCKDFWWRIT